MTKGNEPMEQTERIYGSGFRLDGPFNGVAYDAPPPGKTNSHRAKNAHHLNRIMQTPCPKCAATTGRACWWMNGKPRLHGERFAAHHTADRGTR